MRYFLRVIGLWCVLWWLAAPVAAQDGVCIDARNIQNKAQLAAHIACQEHQLWYAPFITARGQLANIGLMEAEREPLTDGTPAWERVLQYWQGSVGVQDLFRHTHIPDSDSDAVKQALTRVQIVDTPWSGAFVSFLMKQAGFNEREFHFADGHIRYIKPAFTQDGYAFVPKNPYQTSLQSGDLLCYVRDARQVFGVQGFFEWMQAHASDSVSLKMHCDMVVGTTRTRAYAVGGNVAQSVTMRELIINRQGGLSKRYALPAYSGSWLVEVLQEDAPTCSIRQQRACNFNRQDWVVLLRYQDMRTTH